MDLTDIRLSKSALADKVYIGYLDKNKEYFKNKTDITGDFLKAVIDLYSGYKTVITLNGQKYEITVKEVVEEE